MPCPNQGYSLTLVKSEKTMDGLESLIDAILHALLAQASNLKMSKMFDSLEVQNCTNNCLLDLLVENAFL